jgi:hypothetical protein
MLIATMNLIMAIGLVNGWAWVNITTQFEGKEDYYGV